MVSTEQNIVYLIAKILFCWDFPWVNIYVVHISLPILCEFGEVYPYFLQQKSLCQISQLYSFQVTHHPAKRCVTAHQAMQIYMFINLSFHPGNMNNLMHNLKKSAHWEELILVLFFRSIPVWGFGTPAVPFRWCRAYLPNHCKLCPPFISS